MLVMQVRLVQEDLKAVIAAGGRVGVVFDGVRLPLSRYVLNWKIKHKLVHFAMLAEHLNANGWANVRTENLMIGQVPLFPLALDLPFVSHSCDFDWSVVCDWYFG
jgi:hypothetical protein